MDDAIKELFRDIVNDDESIEILNALSGDISDGEILKILLGINKGGGK